ELRALAGAHERGKDFGRSYHHSSLQTGSDSRRVSDLCRAHRQCTEGRYPHLIQETEYANASYPHAARRPRRANGAWHSEGPRSPEEACHWHAGYTAEPAARRRLPRERPRLL